MKYIFVKVGTEVSSRENTLYLDVGNRLCFGIIDHHQLKDIKKYLKRHTTVHQLK